MTYEFKTKPFAHQLDDLRKHYSVPAWAWFWEQGTGKTKEVIDNTGILYEAGEIRGILNLAPNGIHRNFITKQLPAHMPDRIMERARCVFTRADRLNTKWHQREIEEALAYKDGLVALSMSYDTLMTEYGRKVAKELLTSRRCMYAADETGRFKNPDGKRSKRVLASGPYAAYRRITCGTPVDNCPWDVWAQMKFLDDAFWRGYGLDDFYAAKRKFGVWTKGYRRIPGLCNDDGSAKMQSFNMLEKDERGNPLYRNLDLLRDILKTGSSRVLKEDVLDLPPKLYSKHEFELLPEQQAAFDSLKKNAFAILGDSICTAPLAITLLLRLQQVACGYLPTIESVTYDADGNIAETEMKMVRFGRNPRLENLMEITEDMAHSCIIWARFREDINQIMEALATQGKTAVRYDGSCTEDQCEAAELDFQAGRAQFFVANQAKGGEGLTLTRARTTVYYSNTFKLKDRLQSEDRPHRIGQTYPVNYIDLVCVGTPDERIVDSLCGKYDVASQVNGDTVRAWLQ